MIEALHGHKRSSQIFAVIAMLAMIVFFLSAFVGMGSGNDPQSESNQKRMEKFGRIMKVSLPIFVVSLIAFMITASTGKKHES